MADLREIFKDAWSQALAGVNAAEAEAEKALDKLADAAGFSTDDVKRHAREFGERLAAQRKDLEKAIDDAVRNAANRFRIPTKEDIAVLERRLDAVTERLDALSKQEAKQQSKEEKSA